MSLFSDFIRTQSQLKESEHAHKNPYTNDDKNNIIKISEIIKEKELLQTLKKVLSHIEEELSEN